MEYIAYIGAFMANCMIDLWTAFGTWDVIGFSIIIFMFLPRVVNLFKKIININ